jgi:hypothetical protein
MDLHKFDDHKQYSLATAWNVHAAAKSQALKARLLSA